MKTNYLSALKCMEVTCHKGHTPRFYHVAYTIWPSMSFVAKIRGYGKENIKDISRTYWCNVLDNEKIKLVNCQTDKGIKEIYKIAVSTLNKGQLKNIIKLNKRVVLFGG